MERMQLFKTFGVCIDGGNTATTHEHHGHNTSFFCFCASRWTIATIVSRELKNISKNLNYRRLEEEEIEGSSFKLVIPEFNGAHSLSTNPSTVRAARYGKKTFSRSFSTSRSISMFIMIFVKVPQNGCVVFGAI